MKKTLLLALCAGAATMAFAEDRVIYEDDFEYLQAVCDVNPDIIDNIALDDPTTSTPQLITVQTSDGTYARQLGWAHGHWYMGLTSTGEHDNIGWCGTQAVYMGKNFLKFGKEDINARIKLWQASYKQNEDNKFDSKVSDDEYVVVEFDWTPWKNADGKYDEVSLDLDIFTDADEWVEHTVYEKIAVNTVADGQPFQWQHVEVDLSDFDWQPTYDISLKPSKECYGEVGAGVAGFHRWALNNIKLTVKTFGGVHNVEIDANAPKEYFNLQGVRVENPSNGIYIMRQGTKTTKVRF